MLERDLANCLYNSAAKVEKYGAKMRKEYLLKNFIPEEYSKYHLNGFLWIHDLEYYDITYNCLGISLDKVFSHLGVRVRERYGISRPKTLRQAILNTIKLIIFITNQQSGGLAIINFDSDLAKYISSETDEEILECLIEFILLLNSPTRKGSETPYVTLNLGLDTSDEGRRITRLTLKAFEIANETGTYLFPNIVFKVKDGVNKKPGDPNFDLFKQALAITSKLMIPTYLNCDSSLNFNIDPRKLGTMGCRSRIVSNLHGEIGAIGRGNIAYTTINLPRVALESLAGKKDFYEVLETTMNITKEILIHRYNTLCSRPIDDFRFLIDLGLYVNSESENLESMFRNGTLAIGFIGLWECMQILKGMNEIDLNFIENNIEEAGNVLKYMSEQIRQFQKTYNLNFSLLATSGEVISGKFPKIDEKFFGKIAGINDKGFYTNSFHIPVFLEVSPFKKLELEGRMHRYCTGGAISYIEFAEVPIGNSEAVEEIVYAGLKNDCGVNDKIKMY